MSKNSSKKKLENRQIKTSSNDTENEDSTLNESSNKNILNNVQPGIIEVYEDNFIKELKNLSRFLEEYNYIGMDTEFPGTVYCVQNFTKDFYYKTLKLNVNSLKLIQLGITLTNSKGEYPKNYPYHTWQFNLEFDQNKDISSPSSLNLLIQCGIDFAKLKRRGIKHKIFAEYLMTSGLVLNPDVHWVSFHGSYDFGYLVKLLNNIDLPETENEFITLVKTFFINFYDIRILVKGQENLQGGLNKLAQQLEILREGKIHQAGSDSVVTIDIFFKLIKDGLIDKNILSKSKNILYGLGLGADNQETINYFKSNTVNNYQNNNTNLLYIQMNPTFGNMNMNYYYSQMMMNNSVNTNSPLHKNNSGQIAAYL